MRQKFTFSADHISHRPYLYASFFRSKFPGKSNILIVILNSLQSFAVRTFQNTGLFFETRKNFQKVLPELKKIS